MVKYPLDFHASDYFSEENYGKNIQDCERMDDVKNVRDVLIGALSIPGAAELASYVYYPSPYDSSRQRILYYRHENSVLNQVTDGTLPDGKTDLFVQLTKELRRHPHFAGLSAHDTHTFEMMSVSAPFISERMLEAVRARIEEKLKKQIDFYFGESVDCELTAFQRGINSYIVLHAYNEHLSEAVNDEKTRELFVAYQDEFKQLLLKEEEKDRLARCKEPGLSFDGELLNCLNKYYRLSSLNPHVWEGKEMFSITQNGYTIGIEYLFPEIVPGSSYYGISKSLERYAVFLKRFDSDKIILEQVTDDITIRRIRPLVKVLQKYFIELLGVTLFSNQFDGDWNPANELSMYESIFNQFGDNVDFAYRIGMTNEGASSELMLFATKHDSFKQMYQYRRFKNQLLDMIQKTLNKPPFH